MELGHGPRATENGPLEGRRLKTSHDRFEAVKTTVLATKTKIRVKQEYILCSYPNSFDHSLVKVDR